MRLGSSLLSIKLWLLLLTLTFLASVRPLSSLGKLKHVQGIYKNSKSADFDK